MEFYYGVTIFSFILLCLAVITGSLSYHKLPEDLRWFLFYLGFILSIELSTKILVILKTQNLFMYPYYIAGEFFLLAVMSQVALQWTSKSRIIIGVVTILLFLESFSLWISNENVATGYGKIVSHITIISMIGLYLIRVVKGELQMTSKKYIRIYTTLFFYYAISLFLFLVLEQLTLIEGDLAALVWGLNNLLSAFLYGMSFYTFFRLWRLA